MKVHWLFILMNSKQRRRTDGGNRSEEDGGFLYTTTDIAAAKYRYETLKADRALVFSDTRQSQHMQQAWLITRKAGYVPDSFSLEHKTSV